MKIELPWPDTILLPNKQDGILEFGTRRGAYAVKAARDKAKTTAYYETLYAKRGESFDGHKDCVLTIIYSPPTHGRGPDFDGAVRMLKSSIDGIAQALAIDDYYFNPAIIKRGAKVKGGRVTVIIEQ